MLECGFMGRIAATATDTDEVIEPRDSGTDPVCSGI